jgi:hypothetical protein
MKMLFAAVVFAVQQLLSIDAFIANLHFERNKVGHVKLFKNYNQLKMTSTSTQDKVKDLNNLIIISVSLL